MRISWVVALLGVSSATAVFGAAPVAQVIGTESIDVAGIAAPARNFVPMSVGDDVATHGGAAVVQFRDGSNVTLQPNSTLRVEGQAGSPVVRVVQGSASYDLAPYSNLRVLNSRGETINQVLDNALPAPAQLGSGSPLTDPLAAAAIARASRQPGVVVPTDSVVTGRFQVVGGPTAGAAPTTAQVILPNGQILNLTATTNAGVTTYTVASVQEVVGGVTVTTTTDASGLIGATVGGVSGITPNNTQVSVTFTPAPTVANPNPQPLTPTQAQQAIQADVTAAVNTAITNKQLPAGTTAPAVSPVSTAQFSSSSS
ncbi:MAG: hypothetical protein ABSC23_11280 [Bryobacteraceae bacterium]|jgi:hypothetical protein